MCLCLPHTKVPVAAAEEELLTGGVSHSVAGTEGRPTAEVVLVLNCDEHRTYFLTSGTGCHALLLSNERQGIRGGKCLVTVRACVKPTSSKLVRRDRKSVV